MGKKDLIIIPAMIAFTIILPFDNLKAATDINYQELCTGILNSHECAAKIERHRLSNGVPGVTRKGNKLIVSLQSGKEIIFSDSEKDDSDGKWYNYQEYIPAIKYHLIHLQYYEGGGFVFLNANNGKYEVIEDTPIIAPGGKRIATISWCDAYCETGIVIWRMTDKDIMKEYSLTPKEYWGSGELQWLDNDNIKVTIEVPIYGKEIKYLKKHFFLYYNDNAWKTKGY